RVVDPELGAEVRDAFVGAVEQRVRVLHDGGLADSQDCLELLRVEVAGAVRLDQLELDQAVEGRNGLSDWTTRIELVRQIKIDGIDGEAVEAGLDLSGYARAREPVILAFGHRVERLGCELRPDAAARRPVADHRLAPSAAVRVGGVEGRDAELPRRIHDAERLFLALALSEKLGRGADSAEVAAAENDPRDLDIGPAELTAFHRESLRAALPQVLAQRREAGVPVGADACHPVHRDSQWRRRELIERLAPFAPAIDQSRFVQCGQMLGDRLPGDRELGGELGRRRRLARRQRLEDVTAVGVGERIEDASLRVAHTQVRANARSSRAVENSGVDSRTSRRVPSSTSSSVNSTSPWSSQSSTSRSPGSATRTLARRSSPSSQRNTPSPPSRGSSSTSFANHSSSCSASVRAFQTSAGESGKTISRVTSIAPPKRPPGRSPRGLLCGADESAPWNPQPLGCVY